MAKSSVIVVGGNRLAEELVGLAQAASWQKYLLWIHGGPFGESDPLFGRDVGFYVFSLPAYRVLVDGASAVVVLAGLVSAALFWLQGTLDLRRPGDAMPPAAVRLISALLAVFLLLKSFGYWLFPAEFGLPTLLDSPAVFSSLRFSTRPASPRRRRQVHDRCANEAPRQ